MKKNGLKNENETESRDGSYSPTLCSFVIKLRKARGSQRQVYRYVYGPETDIDFTHPYLLFWLQFSYIWQEVCFNSVIFKRLLLCI